MLIERYWVSLLLGPLVLVLVLVVGLYALFMLILYLPWREFYGLLPKEQGLLRS